jgi:small-conductance mechanosensitive channel
MIFRWIFLFFGLFIILCGIHHLIHTITFWYPIYGVEVMNDILMAIVSIGTFFSLLNVLPSAIKLRSPKELEQIVQERTKELDSANQQLKASNQQLRASNQQLDSASQQLRAANQQLAASELGLKEKIKELELFNKAAVGRELKMTELKKEIKNLQK